MHDEDERCPGLLATNPPRRRPRGASSWAEARRVRPARVAGDAGRRRSVRRASQDLRPALRTGSPRRVPWGRGAAMGREASRGALDRPQGDRSRGLVRAIDWFIPESIRAQSHDSLQRARVLTCAATDRLGSFLWGRGAAGRAPPAGPQGRCRRGAAVRLAPADPEADGLAGTRCEPVPADTLCDARRYLLAPAAERRSRRSSRPGWFR